MHDPRRRIGVFIFPDFQVLDAAGPLAVFEIASRFCEPSAYRLSVLSAEGGLVASSAGVAWASTAIAEAEPLDTVIVAGGEGVRASAGDPAVLAWLQACAGTARRVTSVCSGAFVLAAAGLLDGRRATTHWSHTGALARGFPRVRVEPDSIFVRDGPVWTSAGISAGIDLSLALVADDLGEALALRVSRQMVVPRRRAGGQSQHAAGEDLSPPAGRFGPLLDWMRARLDQPLSVECLAEQAAMSPRNFTRAFRAELGVTPARLVERLRLERARARVESGDGNLETVARTSGFGDGERMRRAFIRAYGHPPQAVRRAGAVR